MRRILFTSSGNEARGSWIIRGLQLGNAVGGKVVFEAGEDEIAEADLVVVVKRASSALLSRIHKRGVPWVFDVVDCWPQPTGNRWGDREAIAWLRSCVAAMAPSGIVCATAAMQRDLDGIAPSLTLYHHARPGQKRNPIREEVRTVGYEGSARYLDGWRGIIESECRKRGWFFEINPSPLSEADILVALRGGQWTGFAPRRWKSNVKLANAQGSGTPILCGDECGYAETASGGECFVTAENQIQYYFDALASREVRAAQCELLKRHEPTLFDISNQYRQWLDQLS